MLNISYSYVKVEENITKEKHSHRGVLRKVILFTCAKCYITIIFFVNLIHNKVSKIIIM